MKLLMTMVCALALDASADPRAGSERLGLEVGGASFGELADVSPLTLTRVTGDSVGATTITLPITLQIGMPADAGSPVISWIASFLAGTSRPSNARITSYNEASNRAALSFGLVDFALTRVELPALDANVSRGVGVFHLEGTARRIERLEASGAPLSKIAKWRPANFRVKIDGVDTARITKVGPIVVKRQGNRIVIAPFAVVIAHGRDTMTGWYAWAEKVLVANQRDQRNAKVELLGTDLRKVLATVELTGVTVAAISHLSGRSKTPSTELTLTAETIKLEQARALVTQPPNVQVRPPRNLPTPTPTPSPIPTQPNYPVPRR